MLDCRVLKTLHEHGHKILDDALLSGIQPIELFWAAGKNHAALKFFSKRTMKETVRHPREGWYSNGDTYPVDDLCRKAPVARGKLFLES